MDADNSNGRLASISKQVIGAAFEVSNELGIGFLEKVYERALLLEIKSRGLKVNGQVALPVRYKDELVGNYVADLLVEDQVLVELKCAEQFAPEHVAQCPNYLKASNLKLCLLINFGKSRVEWKRIALGL